MGRILAHTCEDSSMQTSSEKVAGITPINTAYPPGDVRRYGAKLDGATDDSAPLTRAIAQCVQDGGAAVHVPQGTLAIASPITLRSYTKIYGDGPGISAIYGLANTFSLLTDNNSPVTDISIEGLTLEAVSIGSSNRGIFLDADTSTTAERIAVRRCKFKSMFRGANLHRVQEFVFDDCEGESLGSSVVYVGLSASAGRSSKVCIRRMRMKGGDTSRDNSGSGIMFVGHADKVIIDDAEFVDTGAYAPQALTTHHHSVYVRDVVDISITRIKSSGQRCGAGVHVYSDIAAGEARCARVTLAEIRVTGTSNYAGVRIDQVDGLTMSNIECEDCHTQAIYLSNIRECNVSGVIARNNARQGVAGTDNAVAWVENVDGGAFSGFVATDEVAHPVATDNTGDTDGSTGVIEGMANTSDFFVGMNVSVSAGFSARGPFRITSKTASSITVNANSNSRRSNVKVRSLVEYGQSTLFAIHGTCADLSFWGNRIKYGGDSRSRYYGLEVVAGATLNRFSVSCLIVDGVSNAFHETGIAMGGSFEVITMLNTTASDFLSLDQLHKYRCHSVNVGATAWRYESNGQNITAHLVNFPSSGNWLRDDTIWCASAAVSAIPGWRCTANHSGGNGGTWKAMTNLAG